MERLIDAESNINTDKLITKDSIILGVKEYLLSEGYPIVELNMEKPWGAYFRLDNNDSEKFINEFFPSITKLELKLGHEKIEISPKILIVSPGKMLSWQYHNRRAEAWSFLSDGAYTMGLDNNEPAPQFVKPGHIVQFSDNMRHRLIGCVDSYTIVAEVWQHIDDNHPSDEEDIIRL
jgi:mannose-6-phosphate isomerase-like protein (cupin superfamily)